MPKITKNNNGVVKIAPDKSVTYFQQIKNQPVERTTDMINNILSVSIISNNMQLYINLLGGNE